MVDIPKIDVTRSKPEDWRKTPWDYARDRVRELGVDIIGEYCTILKNTESEGVKLRCLENLSRMIFPTLKAVEVHTVGSGEESGRVRTVLSREALGAALRSVMEKGGTVENITAPALAEIAADSSPSLSVDPDAKKPAPELTGAGSAEKV